MYMYSRCASLQHTRWTAFVCALALAVCSVLSKEVGISTLVVFLGYDALLVGHCSWLWDVPSPAVASDDHAEHAAPKRARVVEGVCGVAGRSIATLLHPPVLLRGLLVVATGIAFMQYRLALHAGAPLYQWTLLENQYAIMPPSVWRTLSVLRTHVHYVWLVLWPATLSFDHGFAATTPLSPDSPPVVVATAIAGIAALLACVTGGVLYLLASGRRVACLLCVGWALASFLPASNLFVFVGTEVAERLLYFPTMGLSIAAAVWLWPSDDALESAAACHRGCATSDASSDSSGGSSGVKRESAAATIRGKATASKKAFRMTAVRIVAGLLLATAYGVRTEVRNWDWSSERVLFERGLAVYPDSLKALNNVALLLLNGSQDDVRHTHSHPSRVVVCRVSWGVLWCVFVLCAWSDCACGSPAGASYGAAS